MGSPCPARCDDRLCRGLWCWDLYPPPRACPQDGTSFMSQQEVLQEPHQLRHCFWGASLWGPSGVLQATFYYIENRAGAPTLGRLCS